MMKKDPTELHNYFELITYLNGCLAEDGKRSRPDISVMIVCTIANDHFHEWERDRRYPEFRQIFNIAADMELPSMYEQEFVKFNLHDIYWQKLKDFTDLFTKKLEIWPRLNTAQGLVDYLDACTEHDSLREDIELSVLSLKDHEYIKSLLEGRTYPDLNELIETAELLEEEWNAPHALTLERRNRMSVLMWQLKHTYKA